MIVYVNPVDTTVDKNDRFEWSDGTDFNYENWGSVEPNRYNGLEDCVELRSSGTWNDANCYVSRNFVCEKKISTQCGEGSWLFHNTQFGSTDPQFS
jgi:hypothetical protein